MKKKLKELLEEWRANGAPSRSGLQAAAVALREWRSERCGGGLWENPPLMVTATVDDGMGHGLELIHQWASVIGLRVHPLGLLRPAGEIIAVCRDLRPHFLGLTILQFDSDETVKKIRQGIPAATRILAGGPALFADPDFAHRAGVEFTAKNAAVFLEYMMNYENTDA
ncbi:MAG: hypothetical protein GY859_02230 [Desulfobacterales bacterium]|nr:hypothetical protein [Desulfobacterales bacterium]